MQQALRIEEYDADDSESVDGGRVILNAANAVDAPFVPPRTLLRRTMDVRYGWDQSPERHLLARLDGRPVAMADVELGEWDNRDVAWFYLVVHPDHRRQGHGTALLEHVLDVSRAAGRTKFGGAWWESASTERFAARHGFARASQEIHRVVRPRELPAGFVEQAVAEAAPHAADYELVRVEGRTPETLLPAVSAITAAINDAPIDDLDIEDEVFPVERIRCYETASIESGHRLYRILARHRRTGLPAGHTVVVVDAETPDHRAPARHRRDGRPPRPPARSAPQGRDDALAGRRRAPGGVDRHLERREQRPHDRRQRTPALSGAGSRARLPDALVRR